ncbi:ATP dependent DNA ligase domain-containing protein [Mrakia frigida]|uniref:ATP dependent DNA ligase domain-containing protein n=1 Tax=Mrakia frigida TaxID=29902 RepID=UPI003FCBF557
MPSPTPSPPGSPSGPSATQYQSKIDAQQDEDDDTTSHQTTAALERPPELTPFGDSPPFSTFVHILEKVRDVPTMEKKRHTLSSYFDAWRNRVGLDLFPILRLLIPERDKERSVYGLKEQALAKCYIKVLGLDAKKTEAGRRLTQWKQPTGKDNQVTGDFASVLYEVVKERSDVSKSTLTIDEVHELLDQLSKATGDEAKSAILSKFYHNLEAKDQRWLVRIILKDLKITVKEKSILNIFHPDAMALFNVTSDLRNVCYSLPDPSARIEKDKTKVTLDAALLPQLSTRGTPNLTSTAKKMGSNFIIEEKLDGERIQIHRIGGQRYHIWSRKGKDYTYLYGSNPSEGSLIPFIHDAFRKDVADCILDGEMLAYDPDLDRCLPFGSLKSSALDKSGDDRKPHPCFKVFDILYVRGKGNSKGTALSNIPLHRRKVFLEGGLDEKTKTHTVGVIRQIPGRIEFPYRTEGANTAEDIRSELHGIMERKGEGLILKNRNSLYEPGGRNKDWVKVKPDYFDELGENCDLAVLGGWWGTGSRGGRISTLLLGLQCDDEFDKDGGPMFVTFAKIGSGMNLLDYNWISNWHGKHFRTFDKNKKTTWPSFIKFASNGIEDKPDVWIHPRNSFICSIKASEVIPTADFGVGMTLRFPRCKYIRWDLATKEQMRKNGTNVDLTDNVEGLTVDQWKKFERDHVREINMHETAGGKRKAKGSGPAAKASRAKLPSSFKGFDTTGTSVESQIFAHHRFYVVTDGPRGIKKTDLEKMIFKNGGIFKQDGKPDTTGDYIVFGVSTKLIARTNAMQQGGQVDILKPDWILDSIKRGRALPLFEKYVLHPTVDTKKSAAFKADPETFMDLDEDGSESDTEDEDEIKEEKPFDPFFEGRKKEAEQGKKDYTKNEWLEEVDPSLNEDFEREPVREKQWDSEEGDSEPADSEDEDLDVDFERLDVNDEPRMGGNDEDATMYDNDNIFRYLRFYLDSYENAGENALPFPDEGSAAELESLKDLITSNGGSLTNDIHDAHLTHVVLADFGDVRYREVTRAVNPRERSQQRRRHLVPVAWVLDSLKEETLQAESKYL